MRSVVPARHSCVLSTSSSAKLLLATVAVALTFASSFRSVIASDFSQAKAESLLRAHNTSALLEYARSWTRAEPNSEKAWTYLSAAYGPAGLNDAPKAIDACRHVVEINPKCAPAWNALGLMEVKAGDANSAVEHFRKATLLAPGQHNYEHNLAAAQSRTNNRTAVVDSLIKQEEREKGHYGALDWYNLANDYSSQYEFDRAINAYKKCLSLNPAYGPAWNNLGTVYERLRNDKDALSCYQKSIAAGNKGSQANITRMKQREWMAAHPRRPAGGHFMGPPPNQWHPNSFQVENFRTFHPDVPDYQNPYLHP